jgi:DNA-binding PucR family transcriptional regulator
MGWELPSNRVRDLLRQGAEVALAAPQEWLDELDNATLATSRAIAGDPALAAATSRINRANLLHWAAANVRDPGAPVPANVGPEPLNAARDLVRRGLDASALDSYRVGQNVAWRRWMEIAFSLTSDPAELRELLDVSARSISAFLDATIAAISAQMQAERDELVRGTHAERREVVALILDGAPINRQRAAERLGYGLDQQHTAAVVWSEEPDAEQGLIDRAADTLARAAGSARPLTVIASAATRWMWLPGAAAPDRQVLGAALNQLPGVRVALGSPGSGLEGFRRSHLDALTVQRMLARLGSEQRVAAFDEVSLVALLTQDPERADHFLAHTLGSLAAADPELKATVRAYIEEQCNAARAAERLYTHRNTVLRRLARADQLLPRPLRENAVHVAVALEVLRWRGSGA